MELIFPSNFRIKTWNEAKFHAQCCSSFIHRNDPRDDSSLSSLDGNCHVQRDRRVECQCRVWVEWLQERWESSYLLIIQDALLSERLERLQLISTLYVALRLASFLILAQIIFNLLNQSSSSCFSFLACRCCLRCLIMQKHFYSSSVPSWVLAVVVELSQKRVSSLIQCFEMLWEFPIWFSPSTETTTNDWITWPDVADLRESAAHFVEIYFDHIRVFQHFELNSVFRFYTHTSLPFNLHFLSRLVWFFFLTWKFPLSHFCSFTIRLGAAYPSPPHTDMVCFALGFREFQIFSCLRVGIMMIYEFIYMSWVDNLWWNFYFLIFCLLVLSLGPVDVDLFSYSAD